MVGMGLTLTLRDFAMVFKKPTGILIGVVFQFGLMPLIAFAIGYVSGYYHAYPFIFLGLILISASPGGVTSNIMTYLGKGDLALSVSLTAVCTVAALFFTPFLLTVFGGNVPDFDLPVETVVKLIAVLVIVPLIVGMVVRAFAENFAKRSEKFFALLGVFSLLFLIVVGILGNLEKFADTNRYGVKFYVVTFLLTLFGMFAAGALGKLFKISNFQVRALSIECGLRNASLAMTIAILIQDRMGDFYSSMLFTSGIFGLWMYLAGTVTIFTFKKWLPVTKEDLEELKRAKEAGRKKPEDVKKLEGKSKSKDEKKDKDIKKDKDEKKDKDKKKDKGEKKDKEVKKSADEEKPTKKGADDDEDKDLDDEDIP
jgi:BASS family bile acid:Na+ symporter